MTLAARGPRQVDIGGWWGIVFAIGLLVSGGMVSLPTAAVSGDDIQAFYRAHRQIIVIQQMVGVALLVPLLAFARTLDRRSRQRDTRSGGWVMLPALAVAAAELATNSLALVLALSAEPGAGTAHTLTFALDLADAALFATMALFSFVAAAGEWWAVRGLGVLAAALTLARAFAGPLGLTFLDTLAPTAFLVYVLVLSTRTIMIDRTRGAADRQPTTA